MTQANEPNDYDRQLRHLNRRVERLEDTQISPQEFARAFDRIYQEMGEMKAEMRAEFTAVNQRLDLLETELNGKIDTIISFLSNLRNDLENR